MFSYNIAKIADNSIFLNTCIKIERQIKNIKKEQDIIDVDGSIIRKYVVPGGKRIDVFNDYEVDAVYVDSEIELNI